MGAGRTARRSLRKRISGAATALLLGLIALSACTEIELPPERDAGSKSDERCYANTDCGEGERCNAGEVCLPPPGCRPGQPCPAVCTGYCVEEPDGPWRCMAPEQCPEDAYCSVDGQCLSDGQCNVPADCTLEGNVYPTILCIGYPTCTRGRCGTQCGEPRCIDLIGYDFGPCEAILGWGVVDGVCTPISGCSSDSFELFPDERSCGLACAAR